MGLQDRDYVQDRMRKLEEEGRSDPGSFRGRADAAAGAPAPSAARPSPPRSRARRPASSSRRPIGRVVAFWLVAFVVVAVASHAALKARRASWSAQPTGVVASPAIVGTVTTGALAVQSRAGTPTSKVEMRMVATPGASWTFVVRSGESLRYPMPSGDYRVRIVYGAPGGALSWPGRERTVDLPDTVHLGTLPGGGTAGWNLQL